MAFLVAVLEPPADELGVETISSTFTAVFN
jgi:hypothetical protein